MNGIIIKHFLQTAHFGRIEITEPFGFDGTAFTLEQDKGRAGRDITFASEEISIRFEDVVAEKVDTPYQLPNGDFISHLTMGLDYILHERDITGFEAEVYYIIQKNEVDFTIGILDLAKAKTDGKTFVECKVIQEPDRAKIKRQEDTDVDMFADKDIDGNPITPLVADNILLKAVPKYQSSEWHSVGVEGGFAQVTKTSTGTYNTFRFGVNTAFALQPNATIENTLSFMSRRYSLSLAGLGSGTYVPNDGNSFTLVEAKNEMSNVLIEIFDLNAFASQTASNLSPKTLSANGRVRVLAVTGVDVEDPRRVDVLWQHNFDFDDNAPPTPSVQLPTQLSFTIPLILRGERLYVYIEHTAGNVVTDSYIPAVFANAYMVTTVVNSMKVRVSATATGIDSVVSGVRLHEVYEQTIKSISGKNVTAPRLKNGGELYNYFLLNGYMMSGRTDKPFNVTFKNLMENIYGLVNFDYQATTGNVLIGHENDFYPSIDLGYYEQPTDLDYTEGYADDALVKLVNYEFSKYRKQDNTDAALKQNSIHTKLQYKTPNRLQDNALNIKTGFIADSIRIEEMRAKAFTSDADASLSTDSDVVILNVTQIPPGTLKQMTAYLRMQIDDDGNLLILNSSGNTDSGQPAFSWTQLGFGVGSGINIVSSLNTGAYIVADINSTVLTLTGAGATSNGTAIVNLTYPLSNVLYTGRTTEGIVVNGLDNGSKFANLELNPVRLLHRYFGSRLKMICDSYPNGELNLRSYENNPDVSIKVGSEPFYSTTQNIQVGNLPTPVVEPGEITTRLIIGYDDALELYKAYDTILADGTIGGFVRVKDANGMIRRVYLSKGSFVWVMNVMEFDGRIGYEPPYVYISRKDDLIYINGAGYPLTVVQSENYVIIGDMLQMFDDSTKPLINPTYIYKVMVGGVVPTNAKHLGELLNAL